MPGLLEATGNREGSAPTLGQDGNVEGMNEIGDDGVGGIQAPGNVTNALDGGYPVDNRDNADDSLQTFRVLSIAWLLGMAGFMGYHAFSYLRMRNRIHRTDSGVRQVEPGICEIDGGHLSFVMGLIHPVIYLSSGLDPESRKVVLCHERVHLQRRDYLFKPAALVICCVHWFNPLVHLIERFAQEDIEAACDDAVVRGHDGAYRRAYGETILRSAIAQAQKRKALVSCFGDDKKTLMRRFEGLFDKSVKKRGVALVVMIALLVGSLGCVVAVGEKKPNQTTEERALMMANTFAQAYVDEDTEAFNKYLVPNSEKLSR